MPKNILQKDVSLLPGEFDISTMTTQEPLNNKAEIIKYLKSVNTFQATTYIFKDPVDGTILTCENAAFEDKGFMWSNIAVLFFEKYNVKLNPEFISIID